MKTNKIIGFAIVLIIAASAMAFTQVTKRTVKSSSISFEIKNFGVGVDGTFKGLKINKFFFDKDSLKKSNIDVTVSTKTVNTGNSKRDEHLRKKEYFDATGHSTIRMKSKRFAISKAGNAIGYFNLTMKGKTKEVVLPIYVTKTTSGTTFKSSFSVNRLDYGVGTSSMALSDVAKISILVKTN